MIKLISINEIDLAFEIILDVTHDMVSKGINQWDLIYPNKETIEKDINNNHAYGYYNEHELIGYISLNEIFSKEYNSVNWNYIDNGKPLIIHRLAVKSSFQGQGIAKKIIQFAETHAKNNGYRTIRLDAFSKNRQALGLYEKLEYKYAGDVLFRKGVFVCFDKNII